MEITDAWLMEMGGWQEMKRARAIYAAGAVLEAAFDGTRLTGLVRDAGKDLSTGLLIRSRSDMDNLCTCFQSKRHGTLCAHALAVGTSWVHRHEKQPARPGIASPDRSGPGSASTTSRPAIQPATATGPLAFSLTPNFPTALQRQKLGISVQPAAATDNPVPDLPILLWLGSLQQKTVPPHLSLSGAPQITAALTALAGHPRLFLQDGSKKQPLALSSESARLALAVTTAGPGNIRLTLRLPDPAAQAILPATARETGWLWNPAIPSLTALTIPEPYFELLKTLPPQRPLDKPRRWLAAHLAALQNHFEFDPVNSSPEALHFQILPGTPRFELTLEGNLEKLTARLRVLYQDGPAPFPPESPDISGFPLETAGQPIPAYLLRAGTAAAYLLTGVRWRRRAGDPPGGTLAKGLPWALLTGLLGLAAAGFAYDRRVGLEHLLYIGCFGLLILVVGSRVLFGHSGNPAGFEQRSWVARLLIAGALVAATTRAVAEMVPRIMISHHQYAAWFWGLTVLLWLVWHRRRFLNRDPE